MLPLTTPCLTRLQEERTLEEPAADEVTVSIQATGLCGSDLHYYRHGRNGDIIQREPLSLGHESGGTVIRIGSGVESLRVGDRVAIEVGVPCDACNYCSAGKYNLCPGMRFRSSAKSFPHFQGTLQEQINHPAKWCFKLPATLSLDHAALVEPLSVALHALDRAAMSLGKASVLVFGAGAVGALTAAAVRLQYPEAHVVIADVDEARVKFATTNRFAHDGCTLPLKRGTTTEEKMALATENADLLKKSPGAGGGYDFVFECTGQETCLQSSIYAANAGAKVLMVGMGTPIQTLHLSAAALREVDLLGVFRYANTYARCLALLEKATKDLQAGLQVPDITTLITHRVRGLEHVPEAFEFASRPVDSNGKMVVKVLVEA